MAHCITSTPEIESSVAPPEDFYHKLRICWHVASDYERALFVAWLLEQPHRLKPHLVMEGPST